MTSAMTSDIALFLHEASLLASVHFISKCHSVILILKCVDRGHPAELQRKQEQAVFI